MVTRKREVTGGEMLLSGAVLIGLTALAGAYLVLNVVVEVLHATPK